MERIYQLYNYITVLMVLVHYIAIVTIKLNIRIDSSEEARRIHSQLHRHYVALSLLCSQLRWVTCQPSPAGCCKIR